MVRRHVVGTVLKCFMVPSARSNCAGQFLFVVIGKADPAIQRHTPQDPSHHHHHHRCEDGKSHILFCSFRICINQLKKLRPAFCRVNDDSTGWQSYLTAHRTVHGSYANTGISGIQNLFRRHTFNLQIFLEELSGNFLRNLENLCHLGTEMPRQFIIHICALSGVPPECDRVK